MRVAFRVDASAKIGSGHLMRCLALADALSRHEVSCDFLCAIPEPAFTRLIEESGHAIHPLNATKESDGGLDWRMDADATLGILRQKPYDVLFVDHYALDYQWEMTVASRVRHIGVIDDLANRKHDCSVLIDQTFGRTPDDYSSLAPKECHLLLGSSFAILRPEFLEFRNTSIARRKQPVLRSLLVSLGGGDKDDLTGKIVDRLAEITFLPDFKLTIVLGALARNFKNVQAGVVDFPFAVEVLANVSNMAEILANSDMAIGAAGSSAWERCCLGVPSYMLVIAENQQTIADNLDKYGAAIKFNSVEELFTGDMKPDNPALGKILNELSDRAKSVVDGEGVQRVTGYILQALV